jgi:hypothetical protein
MLADASIASRTLEFELSGEKIQGTVLDLVQRVAPASPSDGALLRAARRAPEQSPAMLEEKARWIEIEDRLRRAGMSTREIVQVILHGVGGAFGFPVSGDVIAGFTRESADAALAVEICEAALAEKELRGIATGALEVLARAGRLEDRFDDLLTLDASGRTLRAVLPALPEARRARVLARIVPERFDARFAGVQLEKLLWVLDLVTAPELRARLALLADGLRAGGEAADLVARFDRGACTPLPPTDADGLTAEARKAYEYKAHAHRDERAKRQLGALARAAHARHVRIDAPELATVERWREASAARREAIARTIAARSKGALAFAEMRVFTDLPIAVLRHERTGTLFSLVPGGAFERGLSAPEEALLRERAAGKDTVARESALLLDRLAEMRPTAEVRTGPVLVAQEACFTGRASHVAMFLEGEPFRLLAEAEWERLSRGDRPGELTARGHHLPDEADLADRIEAGPERSNAFGLWGFGLLPELCADAWHPSYEGAPLDGSPRWGDGPRVIRGGAAELSPWQGCGEWHLLCNAVRASQEGWEIYAVRPALGLIIS